MEYIVELFLFSAAFSALVQCNLVNELCPSSLPHTSTMRVFRDNCYQFVSQEKYWTEARDYCTGYNGRLIKIDDSETNSFIKSVLNGLWWNNNGVWIGLHDRNSELHWQWTGNSASENEVIGHWTNWGHGHPGAFLHTRRDCVRMVRHDGQWKWHETFCDFSKWHYRFICQYKVRSLINVKSFLNGNTPTIQNMVHLPIGVTTFKTTENIPNTEMKTFETLVRIFPPTLNSLLHLEEKPSIAEVGQTSMTWNEKSSAYHNFGETHKNDIYGPVEGAIVSKEEPVEQEGDKLSHTVIAVSIVCSGIALLAFIIIFLIRRRHRNQKLLGLSKPSSLLENQKNPDKNDSLKSDLPGTLDHASISCGVRSASNLYIDAEMQHQIKLSQNRSESNNSNEYCLMNANKLHESLTTYTLPDKHPEIDSSEAENYQNGSNDCGMMGYDMPRPTNVYEEIPSLEYQTDSKECNIYEALDDFQA